MMNWSLRTSISRLEAGFADLTSRLILRISRKVTTRLLAFERRRLLSRKKATTFREFSGSCRRGVNLVGYIRAEMGLGQAARGVAMSLEAAKIPFHIVNFEHRNRAPHRDMSWKRKEDSPSDYDVTLLVVNPDNIFHARLRLPEKLFGGRYVIGCWSWELSSIPDQWLSAFSLVNEVWAPSRFVQQAIALKSPVPVVHIPHAILLSTVGRLPRQYFSLPENCFLFLATCDAASIVQRKNPVGVIDAFEAAFDKNDRTVGLVIKLSGPWHLRSQFRAIRQRIRGYNNIHLLDQPITRAEMDSLLSSIDCFVSLHRAEGFGLPAAEAMSLGKPAILTNWSGNTDYMTTDNSIGIGYRLVRLGRDYGPYEADQYWADPDIDEAACWMKRLTQDPDLARQIGQRGQETIRTNFSPQTVAAVIQKRLTHIRQTYGRSD